MGQQPKKAKDYESLGRMLESIYQSGYIDRNEAYKMSFVKGVVAGVGGVLGATLVVALLMWILSLFNQVPLVGPFIDNIHDTIETRKQ